MPPFYLLSENISWMVGFVVLTTENIWTDVGKATPLIHQLVVVSNKVLTENKVG